MLETEPTIIIIRSNTICKIENRNSNNSRADDNRLMKKSDEEPITIGSLIMLRKDNNLTNKIILRK